MSFNLEPNQEAQEVILCERTLTLSLQKKSVLMIGLINFQKHSGIYLDKKLNLNYHIDEKMTK